MKSKTTTKIILDARRFVDGETSSTTTDLEPDTELLSYLNDAYEEMVDFIVDAGGTDLLATYTDLSSPYTLTGIYRNLTLSKDRGDGTYIDLPRFNFHHRNSYSSTDFPAWRIMNNTVRLYPTNAAPGTLRLWYIPDATTFIAGDSVPVFGGWDTYLSARIALRMLAKEQRHSEEVEQEFKLAARRIQRAVQNTNVAEPEQVATVHRVAEDFYDEGGYPLEYFPRS